MAKPIVGIATNTTEGKTVITGLTPGSPAESDGRLQVGDEIIGVGEGHDGAIANVRGMAPPVVLRRLKGASGTIVRLEVIPQGQSDSRVYEIQRDPTAAWSRAVVEVADHDPWRGRWREIGRLTNEKEQLQALVELADQVDVSKQPVRVLTRLASALKELEALDQAAALLRRVQQAYPSDLWANADLADSLRQIRPPRTEEAIRYYTAAIALRLDSAGLHANLGVALDELGQLVDGFIRWRMTLVRTYQ